jgi:CheY-like chemotaxis protein
MSCVAALEGNDKLTRRFRSTSMMPVMTGEEAVRELRKRGCRVFVVGATGNALKGGRFGRPER